MSGTEFIRLPTSEVSSSKSPVCKCSISEAESCESNAPPRDDAVSRTVAGGVSSADNELWVALGLKRDGFGRRI